MRPIQFVLNNRKKNQVDNTRKNHVFAITIASTFGSGYFPIAPGTVGAAVAAVLLWFTPTVSLTLFAGATVLFFFLGVWVSSKSEQVWGHDAGRINWDEFVGMMITVFALPKTWHVFLAGFLLFRLFDIIKPFPANVSQKLPGGWGVMVDDVIAAIYSNIILQIVYRIILG